MKKQEFIEEVAKKTKLPKSEVAEVVNTGIEVVTKNISKGVVLTGFGTFSVSKRKARNGRNPKTGETIKIPATKVPRFKAGKALKQAVK
ncbi:MAG TPA: HU family DNA-binding protein [Candidatus Pacearchaeota archaeon]|jgi:DNA-binding protein HU-beta|nr:HU family DNA-binding protein [Candidatus Pacearchaeota archaeon]HPZ74641.1 HU family DNA-binding protein [Candidatus Pacearchaeota archaeon]HQD89195.1 HU family DNA-binding protein [Candidatus Pacearchaeota archaeon]